MNGELGSRLRGGRADKREAILQAAARVLLSENGAQASVADIARQAGVAKPTVYAHFESKEELFLAVVERAYAHANLANLAALDALPERPRDLEGALMTLARQLVQNIYLDPDTVRLRRFLQTEGIRHPRLVVAARDRGPQRRLADALAGRFARLAFAGYLSLDDPDRAARRFLALVTYQVEDSDEAKLMQVLREEVRFFLKVYAGDRAETRQGEG